jgi:hypothetical protein
MSQVLLIPNQMCCAEVPKDEEYIGATLVHPNGDPEDKTNHELNVFWCKEPPLGSKVVKLVSLDPFVLDGAVVCYCGWTFASEV